MHGHCLCTVCAMSLERQLAKAQTWLRQVADSYQAERDVHHINGELVDAIRAKFGYPVIDRTSKFTPVGGE